MQSIFRQLLRKKLVLNFLRLKIIINFPYCFRNISFYNIVEIFVLRSPEARKDYYYCGEELLLRRTVTNTFNMYFIYSNEYIIKCQGITLSTFYSISLVTQRFQRASLIDKKNTSLWHSQVLHIYFDLREKWRTLLRII